MTVIAGRRNSKFHKGYANIVLHSGVPTPSSVQCNVLSHNSMEPNQLLGSQGDPHPHRAEEW